MTDFVKIEMPREDANKLLDSLTVLMDACVADPDGVDCAPCPAAAVRDAMSYLHDVCVMLCNLLENDADSLVDPVDCLGNAILLNRRVCPY